ncbi:type II secretion system protein [Desulfosporosinus fructosivorans]|uniref:type II secretion system protein n=1 Tax=Desulfosporosinus fructosivorans TaxID=2018669 RepID=UPI001FB0FFA3|nr:type II secretion system protein GspG [Desulfosporosinus fructosivorans]
MKEENGDFGFILWEILIVVFLMGIILTLATPHFGSATNQVWIRIDSANRARIEGAVQLYRIDVGVYPLSVTDLVRAPNGMSEWAGPYLDEIPINPFDNAQVYQIGTMGQVK